MNDWTIPERVELRDVVEAFKSDPFQMDGSRDARRWFVAALQSFEAEETADLVRYANAFVAAYRELDRIGFDFSNPSENVMEYALAGAGNRFVRIIEWKNGGGLFPANVVSAFFAFLFNLAIEAEKKDRMNAEERANFDAWKKLAGMVAEEGGLD